jgi:citrate synthase
MGRLPGWMAPWKDLHEDPAGSILRLRYGYVGPCETDGVALQDGQKLSSKRRGTAI